MARIPTPDRGQPLDVTYVYQIVEAINELSSQISSARYKYASIDTSDGKNESTLLTETKVVAGERVIYSNLTPVTADSPPKTFSYTFNGEFRYPPIVTATPVLLEGTAAGIDVSVVIQSITNGSVSGFVKFNTGGSVALKVHIIAVGIPN
jgi:hypothetical protein